MRFTASSDVRQASDVARTRSEERALIERAKQGDREAREALLEPYRDWTWKQLRYRYKMENVEDLWDLTQAVMVRALENLGTFHGRSSFKTWLFTIIRSLAFNHMREAKFLSRTVSTEDTLPGNEEITYGEVIADESPSPEDLAISREPLWLLSEDSRVLLIQKRWEKLSNSKMAELWGTSEKKIKVALGKARRELARIVKKQERAGGSSYELQRL